MTAASRVAAPVYDHLDRMTDVRGLFEHALLSEPRVEHGYCVDDVARALVVTCRETPPNSRVHRLERCYLAFVVDAVEPDQQDVAGMWQDDAGTGDWWGRALWGLVVAASSATTAGMRARALTAFRVAAHRRSTDLRATAFSVLGAYELLRRWPEEPAARDLLRDAIRILMLPPLGSWTWPEARLSYANATLAEALVLAGHELGDELALARGQEMLAFLLDVERRGDHLSVTPTGGPRTRRPGTGLRAAADRGRRTGRRLRERLPRHRSRCLARGNPVVLAMVPRRQRQQHPDARRCHRCRVRRARGRRTQREPGRGVHARDAVHRPARAGVQRAAVTAPLVERLPARAAARPGAHGGPAVPAGTSPRRSTTPGCAGTPSSRRRGVGRAVRAARGRERHRGQDLRTVRVVRAARHCPVRRRARRPRGRRVGYRATYPAYDGVQIAAPHPRQLRPLRTHRLAGRAARNEGMALFPRMIGGRYVALCRADGESSGIAWSDDALVWSDPVVVHAPTLPWELLQVANGGPPIETDAGRLVLTQGVGPMRVYSIGAILLDLDDPTRLLARTTEPLLTPADDERDGYVPNVVYSCGGLLHAGTVWIPDGVDDVRIAVAAVDLAGLLASVTRS